MLITNSRFTKQALDFAVGKNLELIDGEMLYVLIDTINGKVEDSSYVRIDFRKNAGFEIDKYTYYCDKLNRNKKVEATWYNLVNFLYSYVENKKIEIMYAGLIDELLFLFDEMDKKKIDSSNYHEIRTFLLMLAGRCDEAIEYSDARNVVDKRISEVEANLLGQQRPTLLYLEPIIWGLTMQRSTEELKDGPCVLRERHLPRPISDFAPFCDNVTIDGNDTQDKYYLDDRPMTRGENREAFWRVSNGTSVPIYRNKVITVNSKGAFYYSSYNAKRLHHIKIVEKGIVPVDLHDFPAVDVMGIENSIANLFKLICKLQLSAKQYVEKYCESITSLNRKMLEELKERRSERIVESFPQYKHVLYMDEGNTALLQDYYECCYDYCIRFLEKNIAVMQHCNNRITEGKSERLYIPTKRSEYFDAGEIIMHWSPDIDFDIIDKKISLLFSL